MELFWLCAGAGGACLVFWFRSTKKRMRRMAAMEFVGFLAALRNWDTARDDFDCLVRALQCFEVFSARYSDFLADPTGRSLPSERAVLSNGFVTHMRYMGLVRYDWRPLRDSGTASDFWAAVDDLQAIRADLIQRTPTENGPPDVPQHRTDSAQDRERDRARLVSLMNPNPTANS